MKITGQTSEDNIDSGALSDPLSFLRSGFFLWNNAVLGGRGNAGDYWYLRSGSTTASNELYIYITSLNPLSNDSHGNGYAVRCVQILHHSH